MPRARTFWRRSRSIGSSLVSGVEPIIPVSQRGMAAKITGYTIGAWSTTALGANGQEARGLLALQAVDEDWGLSASDWFLESPISGTPVGRNNILDLIVLYDRLFLGTQGASHAATVVQMPWVRTELMVPALFAYFAGTEDVTANMIFWAIVEFEWKSVSTAELAAINFQFGRQPSRPLI